MNLLEKVKKWWHRNDWQPSKERFKDFKFEIIILILIMIVMILAISLSYLSHQERIKLCLNLNSYHQILPQDCYLYLKP